MVVNIDVPELQRAIDFYCSALDLKLSRILDDDVAELEGSTCLIYLLGKSSGSPVASTLPEGREYSRHWTPVHIDFVVENLDAAVERAIQAGACQESDCVHWRGSRCVTLSDPFGHGFCLIEFAGDSYL